MIKRPFWAVAMSLAFFCSATLMFGQETSGGIEGYVKDAAGAVVPSVTLTITSGQGGTGTAATSGFRRTVTTNDEGFFRALQIPPGIYTIVTTPTGGFGEAKFSNIEVAIGRNTQFTLTVSPSGTSTSVDVSVSDVVPVDTTSSAIQTSISTQKIELLPKGTGFTSLLKTIPGTRPESKSAGFSVDGASGAENVFVIDGQEVTNYRSGTLNDSYSIPTQLVREVQVKSSGFDAEFGGATGGVISVVTKGGSNEFHGEFGAQFDTPKFAGNPRPLLGRFTSGTVAGGNFLQTAEVFQTQKLGGVNFFPTSNLGGSIIKDKAWFFASYSPQIFETNVTIPYYTDLPAATRTFVGRESYSRSRKYEYAFARIDTNPFSSLRVSSTFLWNPIIDQGSVPSSSLSNVSTSAIAFSPNIPFADYGGGIGRLVGNAYTSRQGGRQTSNLFTVDGVYTPTSTLVLSARYTRGFLNEKLGNYFVPEVIQVSSCAGSPPPAFGCSTTGANTITRKDVSLRQTYDFSGSYIFNGGGRHELKGGYQRFTIFNDVIRGNSTIGQVFFSYGTQIDTLRPGVTPTPGAVGSGRIRRGGTIGFGSNLSQGLFVQDRWQPVNRLTLSLGVRVEKENLPSFNQFPSNINFGWGDKIAPRLGFAYDISGDGKTKFFGSFGRFYDRVKFALPRGLFGGDIQLDDFFEIFPGQTATQFSLPTVVGGFTGASVCPATGFIAAGVLSRCQINGRVNANSPNANAIAGLVDPDLKPFRQTELTFGTEAQVGKLYVFRMRYTYKNVDEAVEDAGVVNAAGSEEYIIGNPGSGLHLARLTALGYTKTTRPERRYDGLETVLERRLSNNWYFNANYTYSRLYGNYTGLASSDEAHLLNGRTDPGVSRAFDLPFIGFTVYGRPDNGRLPTDRPHVFNIYGTYIFDWNGSRTNSTEISGFQTVTSGTPQTTSIYGASGTTPQIFYGRGDLGRSPVYSQTDLGVTHRYKFGRDTKYTVAFDVNVQNLLDQETLLGIYPTMNPSTAPINAAALGFTGVTAQPQYANGYTSGTLVNAFLARLNSQADRIDIRYKRPQLYQSPRAVRFGFRFLF